ncbi:hypothetical protein ADK38_25225, partial [Streptomyces varsoviensis]
ANAAENKAEAAAANANAAANKTEAEASATHAAAMRANANATEATAQEARAGVAAHEAARLAGLAAAEANNALQAANRTKGEAEGAVREAAMARLQATIALQASAAARSTAAGIADPANTAIALTAPFSGKDVDADFAAEVAQAAQEMGQEQVDSAEAKAAEAVKAAEAAEDAAKKANAQVAPAFQAAADAARSSADAARSAASAMKSAAEAAADGAKARSAAARANQADAQAQTDAQLARQAATQAYKDAAAARDAANQAEAEAARARGAAAEADQHASAANSAADLAEREATVAQSAATQAQKDAVAADKLAEAAESHAKSAKKAADNALEYAKEADEAAKQAEKERDDRAARAREEAANSGKVSGRELTSRDKRDIEDVGITPEMYAEYQKLASFEFKDLLKEIGGELLEEFFDVKDIQKCYSEGNVEACFWALVNNLPWGKAFKAVEKFPEIIKAVRRLVGIDKLLDESAKAKKVIKETEEVLEEANKRAPFCPKKPKPKGLAAPGNFPKAWHAATSMAIARENQRATNQQHRPETRRLAAGDRIRTLDGELREIADTRSWSGVRRVYNVSSGRAGTLYAPTGNARAFVNGGHDSGNLGPRREEFIAKLVGGTVAKDSKGQDIPIHMPNVGKSGLDVLGPNGEYIFVGGGAKAKNPSNFGKLLKISKWAADEAGVKAIYYLADNTPESAVKQAKKAFGDENVHIFTLPTTC